MSEEKKQAPQFCPHCGGASIVQVCEWAACSKEEPENLCDVDEFQCQGKCEGKSFWA